MCGGARALAIEWSIVCNVRAIGQILQLKLARAYWESKTGVARAILGLLEVVFAEAELWRGCVMAEVTAKAKCQPPSRSKRVNGVFCKVLHFQLHHLS